MNLEAREAMVTDLVQNVVKTASNLISISFAFWNRKNGIEKRGENDVQVLFRVRTHTSTKNVHLIRTAQASVVRKKKEGDISATTKQCHIKWCRG